MTSVAANAKKIIEQKGLKQKSVAVKAGYTAKVFNALLNGNKIMRDGDIIRIANALDTTPNELFGFTGATDTA